MHYFKICYFVLFWNIFFTIQNISNVILLINPNMWDGKKKKAPYTISCLNLLFKSFYLKDLNKIVFNLWIIHLIHLNMDTGKLKTFQQNEIIVSFTKYHNQILEYDSLMNLCPRTNLLIYIFTEAKYFLHKNIWQDKALNLRFPNDSLQAPKYFVAY